MERAARLIKNKKVSSDLMTDEDLIRAAWRTAVGRIIASHTSHLRMVRKTLIVEVEDALWQRQLRVLSRQILQNLNKVTGGCSAMELEFRIGVPRRQPQRAETRESGNLSEASERDESETIRDPMLRKVYRLSRGKATA